MMLSHSPQNASAPPLFLCVGLLVVLSAGCQLDWNLADDPDTADTGVGQPRLVDIGAFECQPNNHPGDDDDE